MVSTENIFVCLVAPLLAGVLLMKGEARRFAGFFTLGLLACLLSAYVNGFLAVISYDGAAGSIVRLTPICEEIIKALPVLFYLAVLKPDDKSLVAVAIAVGLGFATLENVCFIIQHGASGLAFALARGFSAGLMHTAYAALVGYGLAFVRKHEYLLIPGAFSLLCIASIFHSTYNLLVQTGGGWRTAGYVLPVAVAAAVFTVTRLAGRSDKAYSNR